MTTTTEPSPSQYPEHDKLTAVQPQTQAIGEFIEWLANQGVQLMRYREDLTDSRPTDPECPDRRQIASARIPCDPTREDGDALDLIGYSRLHCKHWHDPERGREHPGVVKGTCCRCGKGRYYEVTGIRSWVHEQRGIQQLLADWAGIDLKVIEQEKRAMLAAVAAMNGGR